MNLQESADTYARLLEKVMAHMKWDETQAGTWFLTKNPHLGNVNPFKLIILGRAEYLEKWIDNAIYEGRGGK